MNNTILDDYLAEVNQSIPDDHRATVSTRLVNFILDTLSIMVILYIIHYNIFHFREVFDFLAWAIDGAENYVSWFSFTIEIIFLFFIYTMYYTLFESLTGRTPGKMMTKSYVVASNGTKPTVAAIFGRSSARLVPLEVFSVFNKEVLPWHDQWTKTMIVDARKTPMRRS